MFRLQGAPQIDPQEEKRLVRKGVQTNIFTFALLCATIRIGEFFITFFYMNIELKRAWVKFLYEYCCSSVAVSLLYYPTSLVPILYLIY